MVVGARRAGSCSAARSPRRVGAGFILARKPGKLPRETSTRSSTSSSTASTRSRCTATPSPAARACSCTTTCSPPAARRARAVRARRAGRAGSWRLRVRDRAGVPRRARAAARPRRPVPRPLRRREMPVRHTPQRTSRAPPSEVWRLVSDPERLPRGGPGVQRVEEATPSGAGRRCSTSAEGQDRAGRLHARGGTSRGGGSCGARRWTSRRSSGSSPSRITASS